jgi:hypothetical protein
MNLARISTYLYFLKKDKSFFYAKTISHPPPLTPSDWQRGSVNGAARSRWPRRGWLTDGYSPATTSPARRSTSADSSLPHAHAGGTGWVAKAQQWLHRRPWWDGGAPARRQRPTVSSSATLTTPANSPLPRASHPSTRRASRALQHAQQQPRRLGGAPAQRTSLTMGTSVTTRPPTCSGWSREPIYAIDWMI